MKKIEAIIKPHRLEEVMEQLRGAGVTGMTISDVKGFGRTGGRREVYRGSAYFVDFVPKVRIEILIRDEVLHDVVALIASTARTGQIGDGKIFVSTVDDAIRIRTEEHGEAAISSATPS
jgi:nitrogen regulatory protein P-II 1